MKEGVTVFEPKEGQRYLEFNTYPIDTGVASEAGFYELIHTLKERGFVERHGEYLRWYPPRSILNVTWRTVEGEETPLGNSLLEALVMIDEGVDEYTVVAWLLGKLALRRPPDED